MSIKKTLATTAGVAVGIGAGLTGFGLSAVGAQDDPVEPAPAPETETETEAETETPAEDDGDNKRRGRSGNRRGRIGVETSIEALGELGLSAETLREGRADGQSIGQIAEANGVSSEDVVDALIAAANERFAAADRTVDADAVAERIQRLVDHEPLTTEEREAAKAERQAEKEASKAALADTLGVTVDEMTEALRDGQTLGDIAEANGVDAGTVIEHLVDRAQAKIDAKVADGSLTEEQAAEKSAQLEERATTIVEEGKQRRGHRGHRSHRGSGAKAEAQTEDSVFTGA